MLDQLRCRWGELAALVQLGLLALFLLCVVKTTIGFPGLRRCLLCKALCKAASLEQFLIIILAGMAIFPGLQRWFYRLNFISVLHLVGWGRRDLIGDNLIQIRQHDLSDRVLLATESGRALLHS